MLGIVNHLCVLLCLNTWVYAFKFSFVCVRVCLCAGKLPPDAAGLSERRVRG